MSSPWLPRAPAFASLRPAYPVADPVEPALAALILGGTGLRGALFKLRTSPAAPLGHYRLRGEDGTDLFLKVLRTDQTETQSVADRLCDEAARRGAPVAASCGRYSVREDLTVWTYPYIEGRYAEPADGAAIGAALVRLHDALAASTMAPGVREASERRMAVLAARREEALGGLRASGPDPEALRRVLAETDLAPAMPDAQIIHGDLNMGNVIVECRSGAPTFIDFETSTVTWASPGVDVAQAIQRLCLLAPVSDAEKVAAVRALVDAYAASGRRPAATAAETAGHLQWLSARNLCLLLAAEGAGRVVAAQEFRKFLDLWHLAREQEVLLRAAGLP